jgi:RNA polymerase sigma-70 factor (ECF subfamily)
VVVAQRERVPDDALPWLYRTAWNVIANLRRSEARRVPLVLDVIATDDPAGAVAERGAVMAALLQLSDADREALLLVAWEGLDARRAAAAAGCSAATFSVRLHRARRRLERALALGEEAG